jgi:peptide/nickel transport system ATP-binding protein/oligopeptide transport system ATP-binding protein
MPAAPAPQANANAANAAANAPAQPARPPLLQVENLSVRVPPRPGLLGKRSPAVTAVNAATFTLQHGETLGIVGESGSGKTTTGRAIVKLVHADTGKIAYDGEDITTLTPRQFFPWRKRIQMVFQDPWHSLNPRLTIGAALAEPLEIHFPNLTRAQRRERVADLLRRTGLEPDHAARHPHELSGGQRQRVGIARALAVEPELIICDEPVSALDVVIQAQIIHLLRELQATRHFACIFISHDLAIVEQLCPRVLVMRAGEIVEQGPTEELYRHPRHPYTRELLDAVPSL